MEQALNYVKPELLVVSAVLYFMGTWMKQSEAVPDRLIPAVNGVLGIVICGVYVFATCACRTGQEAAMAVFTAMTQGVLVAGLSTYVHQIGKQAGKTE